MASFNKRRAVVDSCRTDLVLRTVAVHLGPSRLALDKGRFEHMGGDVVDVNGDMPVLYTIRSDPIRLSSMHSDGMSTPAWRAAEQAWAHG